ncbi:hypothetical protein CHT98_23230 (plasmid) [Azospirillum brasilense]|uniref:Uncharacterized protein n=1 Tax=Azospirillum brasilense TaxID=192 RepID=A0A235H885_AZOBR|nr:hypothetical protein CHT98_23230 [Azospirillum brasilense]
MGFADQECHKIHCRVRDLPQSHFSLGDFWPSGRSGETGGLRAEAVQRISQHRQRIGLNAETEIAAGQR